MSCSAFKDRIKQTKTDKLYEEFWVLHRIHKETVNEYYEDSKRHWTLIKEVLDRMIIIAQEIIDRSEFDMEIE